MKTLRIATMFGLIILGYKTMVFTGKTTYNYGVKPVAKAAKWLLF